MYFYTNWVYGELRLRNYAKLRSDSLDITKLPKPWLFSMYLYLGDIWKFWQENLKFLKMSDLPTKSPILVPSKLNLTRHNTMWYSSIRFIFLSLSDQQRHFRVFITL